LVDSFESVYPICQEFLGLLPKARCHCLLHITVSCECTAFKASLCNNPKMWKSHGGKSRRCAVYSCISHHMAFSWYCTQQAAWGWALFCSRIMLSLLRFLYLGTQRSKCVTVTICG